MGTVEDVATALDAGSGEGADAIWLAERGWHVTAVDFSAVALQRAADHARQRGSEVAGRIEWVRQDLTTRDPGPERYDLVTAQYLHLPPATRRPLLRRLAAAVAPGGTLLVVGHHPSDLQTTIPRPQDPDRTSPAARSPLSSTPVSGTSSPGSRPGGPPPIPKAVPSSSTTLSSGHGGMISLRYRLRPAGASGMRVSQE